MALKTHVKKWLVVLLALAVLLPTAAIGAPVSAATAANYGVQTYEAYEAKKYDVVSSTTGIAGNGEGRVVSNEQNHTAGGSNSIKLEMAGYKATQYTPQTVALGADGTRLLLTKGELYTVSVWLYSETAVSLKYRLASIADANDPTWGKRQNEKEILVDLAAGEWKQVTVDMTLTGIPGQDTTFLTIGTTYADSTVQTTGYVYLDDVQVEQVDPSAFDYQTYEAYEAKKYDAVSSTTGIAGNGEGRVVSNEQNHTPGGSNSIKLEMAGYKTTQFTPQTVALGADGTRLLLTKGKLYTVSVWLYSETAISLKYRLASIKDANDPSYGTRQNEKEVLVDLAAGEWKQVTLEVTLTGISGQDTAFLTIGATYADSTVKTTGYVYLDDVSVTEYVPASPVTTFNGGLLYTGGKVGSLNGETGSAVYTVDGTQYTAMRVAADYTCVDNDPTKVAYDGGTWTVVGRGVLLNYSYTAGEDGTPTVDDTASYLKKNYITGDALKSYWSLEDNTLRYSVLVKNLNQEKATGLYLTYRSYMVITDGTNEVTVYGDTVSDVTVQKLYEAATSQGASVKWFDE